MLRDPFAVLGVSEVSSVEEIKRAYLAKALEVHPDVNAAEDAQKKFVELTNALETLINPDMRADYLRRRQDADLARVTHKWRHSAQGRTGENHARHPFTRRRRGRRRMPNLSDLAVLRKSLEEELDAAMHKARMGPLFVPKDASDFPLAFELEECDVDIDAELHKEIPLMQVVSGRQLLGDISISEFVQLPRDNSRLLEDSSRSSLSSSSSSTTSNGESLFADTLELKWLRLDGAPMMYATRWPADDSGLYKIHVCDASSGELLADVRDSLRETSLGAVLDGEGRDHHRILSHRTPGVSHMAIISKTTGRQSIRASRAWLPPSSMWYHSPRNDHMTTGGWYIERNEKSVGDLHAAIPIFLCGFRTLDRHRNYTGPSRTATAIDFISTFARKHLFNSVKKVLS